MAEFRVLLEGGSVLVVSLSVEEAEDQETDPTTIGQALLNALGIGGRTTSPAFASRPSKPKRPVPPPEPTAEEWLEQTSREALRQMRNG